MHTPYLCSINIKTKSIMNKSIYNNCTVNVILQQNGNLASQQCVTGIITQLADNKLEFVQTVRRKRPAHCPKLFDGRYIVMIRTQTGHNRLYLKNICTNNPEEGTRAAVEVAREISEAIKYIHL